MATLFNFSDVYLTEEGLMHVMNELKLKNCMDSTLLSNLDFVEGFLRKYPINGFSKCLVKGNSSCMQIGNNSPILTVSSDKHHNINLHVNVYRKNSDPIDKYNIMKHHFFGHSCQDEITSCFMQAKAAICGKQFDMLLIKCNKFSITYANNSYTEYECKTVETKCQFKLETITVEGLLEKKNWLQKEKVSSNGLIACLDHLIKLYLSTPDAPKNNCRFLINADNETVRIISSGEEPEKEYVLLYDLTGVSMFPPTWH